MAGYGQPHQLGVRAGAGLSVAATGAREFDFTVVAVTRPFKRFRSASVDCD